MRNFFCTCCGVYEYIYIYRESGILVLFCSGLLDWWCFFLWGRGVRGLDTVPVTDLVQCLAFLGLEYCISYDLSFYYFGTVLECLS